MESELFGVFGVDSERLRNQFNNSSVHSCQEGGVLSGVTILARDWRAIRTRIPCEWWHDCIPDLKMIQRRRSSLPVSGGRQTGPGVARRQGLGGHVGGLGAGGR
jgi:hypothetical protein